MEGPDNGDSSTVSAVHPERFDPDRSADTLMSSEHHGRYTWAAQAAGARAVLDAGCGTGYGMPILAQAGASEVTGVDIDADAVAAASRRTEPHGATVLQADLEDLELPDDSFDLAVCFETIEHLASPEQGIAELRRVIRPGGILVVSSPNPDVYPSGNGHHINELRPDELRGLVEGHFPKVRVHLQQAWLASFIQPENGSGMPESGVTVRRTSSLRPSDATFAIVVGCDGESPQTSPVVSLGDPFEVRWWEDRVIEAQHGDRADGGADSVPGTLGRLREVETRLREVEDEAAAGLSELKLESARELRAAGVREADLRERLRKTSSALIDANQELAQMPLLKHRLSELYERNAGLETELRDLLSSRSWRMTGFLRRWKAALKP